MKPIRLTNILILLIFASSCSGSKNVATELPIQASHVYFQNWTTDISIGSSGTNIFVANLTAKKSISIDSVYFRKMKGKLVKGRSLYSCQLTRMLPNSQGNVLTTEGVVLPIHLENNECAVSYTESGETKYYIIKNVTEKEGVHYKYGPPEKL